jgi:hypothetical protein
VVAVVAVAVVVQKCTQSFGSVLLFFFFPTNNSSCIAGKNCNNH